MKKNHNPPKIPKKFSSYILINPSYPVETIYQLLSHTINQPLMLVRGKPEDFADDPSIMFRKVNQEIKLNQPGGETK